MNRFICLKIWPRLPNQSNRAIQELNTCNICNADSNDHTKDLVRSTNYAIGLGLGFNVLPEEKRINGRTTSDAREIRIYNNET